MKRVVLGLMCLVSFAFSEIKKGDIITSSGSFGCAEPIAAIKILEAQNAVKGRGAAYASGYLGAFYKKFPSCKKITYGLDLKVNKVEFWGPRENRNKYRVIMVELPNSTYKWTIL